jgi:phosphomannomutase
MSRLFLFDMDGTLTEPRQVIEREMINKLLSLMKVSKVGIVTGSDYDYVIEQCLPLFEEGVLDPNLFENLTLYPCNGTKIFKWSTAELKYKEAYSVNMIGALGQDNYNAILSKCLEYQTSISTIYRLPYTGTFLHYRGSMLNWCPIGRVANADQRSTWIEEDRHHKIREHFHSRLVSDMKNADIQASVTLGGSTSFDIYPTGWDKTYVLNHVDNCKLIFMGDKCKPGGNDHTIYTALDAAEDHQSYSTCSPIETIRMINKYI